MKIIKIVPWIVSSLLMSSLSQAAPPDILPGLWENKIDISSKSGQIEEALQQAKQMMESMPPEQQKMMKDMMAKQGMILDRGQYRPV